MWFSPFLHVPEALLALTRANKFENRQNCPHEGLKKSELDSQDGTTGWRRCIERQNGFGIDAGCDREWLGRTHGNGCDVEGNINILRNNRSRLDAARRNDSANGSRLRRAATVSLSTVRQITKAKERGSADNDQKHHRRGNLDFGLTGNQSDSMLRHVCT